MYALLKEEGDINDRAARYQNLCIATNWGKAADAYQKSHNKYGQELPQEATSSPRAQAVSNARRYLGTNERPAGSNRGLPQPSGWQIRTYGSAGVPWCACFTSCMCWDAGVKGSSSAGVAVIVSMAKRGQGMFRGYTTNPANVQRGDMAIVGCGSCHIGLVADSNNPYHLIEGNTSPGTEGSQFNGGTVAEKTRPKGNIIGWALVDYPG